MIKRAIRAALDSRAVEGVVAVTLFWTLYDTGWLSGLGLGFLLLVVVSWIDDILFE